MRRQNFIFEHGRLRLRFGRAILLASMVFSTVAGNALAQLRLQPAEAPSSEVAAAANSSEAKIESYPLDAASPFGGYKQSGYGRELGAYALDLYTQIKSVWVDLS